MANIHRPRRGSLAFSPRKRAKSEVPRIRSWTIEEEKARMAGFAGYKAGMTHIIMIDNRPKSLTVGMEISVPVTVVEVPPMNVAALRVYQKYNGGLRPAGEAWAEDLSLDLSRALTAPKSKRGLSLDDLQGKIEGLSDVRLLAHTNPRQVTGVPKKKPDLMEMAVAGGSLEERFNYARSILGRQLSISNVFNQGDLLDVSAVTKGKGTQGPVKRWGIMLQKRKHARTGKLRHVGNLGPWHPARVMWTVPQLGQMGYQQRTEFNKRLFLMGTDGMEINPDGGFPGYGLVRGDYVLIKGSLPGPIKRLIRMRKAVRAGEDISRVPEILHICKESKQGL